MKAKVGLYHVSIHMNTLHIVLLPKVKSSLQSRKWIVQTRPHTPSFVLLYWQVTKGRQQIVWEGEKNSLNNFCHVNI